VRVERVVNLGDLVDHVVEKRRVILPPAQSVVGIP